MSSSTLFSKIESAKSYIQGKYKINTDTAIITGTGIAIDADIVNRISYAEIPHFVKSTVQSHTGELQQAKIEGKEVLIMAGRMHYYEGYSAQEITFPIRVLKSLGIKKLIITNVSGGLNPDYQAGDIVLLKDHIFLQPDHPLRGENDERLGPRFPDMLDTYSPSLRARAKNYCDDNEKPYHEGVYACLQGPSLETPAEYNYLRIIGADMVGMSTIPEVIVARHSGLELAVLSIISNVCYPIHQLTPTTIAEVIEVAQKANPTLNGVIRSLI